MKNVHTDPNCWQCPICKDVLGSKGHLWTHVRHHLGKWYYYCDIKYKDDEQVDDKGKPKVVVCNVVSDERAYMEYHHETVHEVGKASVRCTHCNDPQQSNRARKRHEKICKKGPTDPGEPTDFCTKCDYSCRGDATMQNHMRTDHHIDVGLAKPRRWHCKKCGKVFKSAGGAKSHVCKVKKRSPSAAQSKRKIQNIFPFTHFS